MKKWFKRIKKTWENPNYLERKQESSKTYSGALDEAYDAYIDTARKKLGRKLTEDTTSMTWSTWSGVTNKTKIDANTLQTVAWREIYSAYKAHLEPEPPKLERDVAKLLKEL